MIGRTSKYRVRKCGLNEIYLQADGSWGDKNTARKFSSEQNAIKFAEKNNLYYGQYGIF